MLTENDIIDRLSKHLEKEGYEIIKKSTTSQKGIDLIAEKNGKNLLIEAKGQTSSKPTSARYGLPFSRAQVKSHVATAILSTMKNLDTSKFVAIALPDTDIHRSFVTKVKSSLFKLGIKVFWVSQHQIRVEE